MNMKDNQHTTKEIKCHSMQIYIYEAYIKIQQHTDLIEIYIHTGRKITIILLRSQWRHVRNIN